MREKSAPEKIWRPSGLFSFGVTVFFSYALASFAPGQTSSSPLIGGSKELDGSLLDWRSSEGTLPGTMTMNRTGILLGAAAFAGRHEISHSGGNAGAVTLATHYGNSFTPMGHSRSVDLARGHAFSDHAFPRQLFESATQRHLPAQTIGNANTNFISFPAMATFPEGPLAQEITPVAEPGTWIAAGLAAAFLMWKRRKSLLALFSRCQFIIISAFPGASYLLKKRRLQKINRKPTFARTAAA